jgi:CRISPR-associated protein Cas2
MTEKHDIIVAYDIDDNKQRKDVFEQLRDLGLHPVQKSVFWGRVLPAEHRAIIAYLSQTIAQPNKALVLHGSFNEQLTRHACGYPAHAWQDPDHVCV